MALLMAVAMRIVKSDAYMRAGRYEGWDPLLLLGADVHHKTMGVLGFGRVGSAVAKPASGFDMRVLYQGHHLADPELEKRVGATYLDLKTLLKESHFLSLHVPLTEDLRRLINDENLALMKPTAFIINTARGEVVDEEALVKAMEDKVIAGAGFDVLEHEPAIHPVLFKMQNVVIFPHIGSASLETRTRMGWMAEENLIAAFKGKIPPNCLNPVVFER